MAFGDLKSGGTGTLIQAFASTNSVSINGGSGVAVAVGDFAVIVVSEGTSINSTGASDNLGNTYTAQNAGSSNTNVATATGRMFYSRITVAGTLTTISVTGSASGNAAQFVAAVFTGPVVASPIDVNTANVTGDISSPMTTNATGTLAQASEIAIAWGVVGGTGSPNLTGSAGSFSNTVTTSDANGATHMMVAVPGSTASLTASWTLSGSILVSICGVASFKAFTSTNQVVAGSFAGAGGLTANLRLGMLAKGAFAGAGGLSASLRQGMAINASFGGLGALTADLIPIDKRIEANFAGAGSLSGQIYVYDFMRPDADDLDGSWTNEIGGTTLFPSVDEIVVDDADYIRSSSFPVTDVCRLGLSNPVSVPEAPATLAIRYRRNGVGTVDLTVRLKQGVTTIATWTYTNIGASFITAEETLTGPQFAAITDFNDLFVELEAD